jgi:hypothetical protein
MGAPMIKALAGFDPRSAAGVLARTALALDGDLGNPAVEARVQNEEALRQQILSELRARLDLGNDYDEEAIERLYQAIEDESDRLLGLPDLDPALERLSERGELPSDRYVVEIQEPVREVAKLCGLKPDEEEKLVRLTVREPHGEQHYGPEVSDDQPSLRSLFARRFSNRFPQRDFILLLLGRRDGVVLEVDQAWRIYPAHVDLRGVSTLVEMTRHFAERFGCRIKIGDQAGKFILWARIPWRPGSDIHLIEGEMPQSGKFLTSMSFRLNEGEGIAEIAFAMSIDTESYGREVRKLARHDRPFAARRTMRH